MEFVTNELHDGLYEKFEFCKFLYMLILIYLNVVLTYSAYYNNTCILNNISYNL